MIRIFLTLSLWGSFIGSCVEGAQKAEDSFFVIKRYPQKVSDLHKELNRQVKFYRHKSTAKKSIYPLTPKIDDCLYGKGRLKEQLNRFTKTNGPSSSVLLNQIVYEVEN